VCFIVVPQSLRDLIGLILRSHEEMELPMERVCTPPAASKPFVGGMSSSDLRSDKFRRERSSMRPNWSSCKCVVLIWLHIGGTFESSRELGMDGAVVLAWCWDTPRQDY
jgi:hypothetical protein